MPRCTKRVFDASSRRAGAPPEPSALGGLPRGELRSGALARRGVAVRDVLGFFAALAAAALVAWTDPDAGLRTWWRLHLELSEAEARIADAEARLARLAAERKSLQADPFAVERAIREDLDWVRPGEVLVRMPSRVANSSGLP